MVIENTVKKKYLMQVTLLLIHKFKYYILFPYNHIEIIMDYKLVKCNSDTKNILINEPVKTFYIKQSDIQPANDFYVCLYIADSLIGFTNTIHETITFNNTNFYKIKLFENDVILPLDMLDLHSDCIYLIGATYSTELIKICDFSEVYYEKADTINGDHIEIGIKYIDSALANTIRAHNKSDAFIKRMGINNDNSIRFMSGMCGLCYTWENYEKFLLPNIKIEI
jgi:hypothetical protein